MGQKLFLFLVMFFVGSLSAYGQKVTSRNDSFMAPGVSSAVNLFRALPTFHKLAWGTEGLITSCSVSLERSADGITWITLIAPQDCSVNSTAATPSIAPNKVRVNVLSLSGGGTLNTTYSGYDGIGCGVSYSGAITTLPGPEISLGSELDLTVPAGERWRFLSMNLLLDTDATPGDRVVFLTLRDGEGAVYLRTFADRPVQANQIGIITAASFGTAGGISPGPPTSSTTAIIALPVDLLLLSGHRVTTTTQGLQPGDDYTAPRFLVERCPN